MTTVADAIRTSIVENRTVNVTVTDLDEVYAADGYEDSAEVDGRVDAWGTTDAGEWRLSVLVVEPEEEIEPAGGMLFIVETMPEHLRGSHRAARNWGVYPHNGAIRETLAYEDALEIVEADPDGYAWIVGPA